MLKTRLTRIGLHVAFLGGFAMLGGAIRGLNLLLLLAGILSAALLIQWRLCRGSILGIGLRRHLPDEAFAGVPFRMQFSVVNQRTAPAWLLRLDDPIGIVPARLDRQQYAAADISDHGSPLTFSNLAVPELHGTNSLLSSNDGRPKDDDADRDARRMVEITDGSCPVTPIVPGGTAITGYDCRMMRRGRYYFGPTTISSAFPFGLIRCQVQAGGRQSLDVYPQLVNLRGGWRRLIGGEIGGSASRKKRSGVSDGDFFGLRGWRSGDSRRWIHWRTTARIGEPVVRQFENRQRLDICIVVDAHVDGIHGAANPSTTLPGTTESNPSESPRSDDTRDDWTQRLRAAILQQFPMLDSRNEYDQQLQAGRFESTFDAHAELAISLTATVATKLAEDTHNRITMVGAGVKNRAVRLNTRDGLRQTLRMLASIRYSDQVALGKAIVDSVRLSGIRRVLVISPRPQPDDLFGQSTGQSLDRGSIDLQWWHIHDPKVRNMVRPMSEETPPADLASAGSNDITGNKPLSEIQEQHRGE